MRFALGCAQALDDEAQVMNGNRAFSGPRDNIKPVIGAADDAERASASPCDPSPTLLPSPVSQRKRPKRINPFRWYTHKHLAEFGSFARLADEYRKLTPNEKKDNDADAQTNGPTMFQLPHNARRDSLRLSSYVPLVNMISFVISICFYAMIVMLNNVYIIIYTYIYTNVMLDCLNLHLLNQNCLNQYLLLLNICMYIETYTHLKHIVLQISSTTILMFRVCMYLVINMCHYTTPRTLN